MVFFPDEDRPVEVEGVPLEEGIDEADAAERLGTTPEEQENYPDADERRVELTDPDDPDESLRD